jgi:hypothetical protein
MRDETTRFAAFSDAERMREYFGAFHLSHETVKRAQ